MLHLLPTGSAGDQTRQPVKAAVAWMLGMMAPIRVVEPLENQAGCMAAAHALTGKQGGNGLKKLTHECCFQWL